MSTCICLISFLNGHPPNLKQFGFSIQISLEHLSLHSGSNGFRNQVRNFGNKRSASFSYGDRSSNGSILHIASMGVANWLIVFNAICITCNMPQFFALFSRSRGTRERIENIMISYIAYAKKWYKQTCKTYQMFSSEQT